MRRITAGNSDERGAIGILVAMLMVVFLGFAALAVDVGLMYAERAQLQNGADAAALSIARSCAMEGDPVCNETSALDMAKSYANGNANDGLSHVQSVKLTDKTVTVTTGAMDEGGEANMLPLYFARILGNSSAKIGAVAEAGWGGHSKKNKIPFAVAFSKCEVDATAKVDGSMKFLRSSGIDDKKKDDPCHGTSSGLEIPGGFGWLQHQVAGSCTIDINLTNPWIATESGNGIKPGCPERLDIFRAEMSKSGPIIELFPVFDDKEGGGAGGKYRISSFVAFRVHGWNFNGHTYMLPDAKAYWDSQGFGSGERGFIGTFVRYVAPGDPKGFAGSTQYGAKAIALLK